MLCLGCIISKYGFMADPDKVKDNQKYGYIYYCNRGNRCFIGICSYYQRFIPNFFETSNTPY